MNETAPGARRELIDAISQRRMALMRAALPFIWDPTSTKGHPDPAVREHARTRRMERVWPDQLVEISPGVGHEEEWAQVKDWSGWPDLPSISWGSCATCANALNGHERGYAYPCSPCKRPTHSHHLPASGPPSLTPVKVAQLDGAKP